MTADADPPAGLDPFRLGEIARIVPTTDAQREVIAAAALGTVANTAYNEAVVLRLRGRVDAEVVESALATLVRRHDALRATFSPQLDTLCIAAEATFAMERIDLGSLDADAQATRVAALHREWVSLPLPLCEGPLFRARWLQLGEQSAELLLLAHHAICDGWSYHVLLRELAELCANVGPDEQPGAQLPAAPSFADFAAELAHRSDRTHGAHWLRKFQTAPAPLDLPTDRARPAQRTFAAHCVTRRLGEQTSAGLAALAARARVSPVTVLLAGVAALLHRLTDATELVLGMPVARQVLEDRRALVGHCVQLLPISLQLDASMPFAAVIAQVRGEVLDATEHYDFTFGSLVQALGLSGDASRVPLIPVVVNLDQRADRLMLGEVQAEVAALPRVADSFELFLNVACDAQGQLLEATFNADLFDRETMVTWLAALEGLLLGAIAAATSSVGTLPLMSPGAQDALGLVGPAVPLEFETWLHALARMASATPAAIAVVDDCQSLCYGALLQRIGAIAAALRARGVQRGEIVGLAVSRSCDLVAALAAIHACGAAHLPLDPSFPPARLRLLLDDAHVRCVVIDAGAAALGVRQVLDEANVAALDLGDVDAAGDAGDLGATGGLGEVTGDDLAYLIYTSGSTGVPKGVRVTHRSLANLLASVAVRPGCGAADTLLAVTTISFDISLLELLLPLTVGGRVAVAAREDAEDPQRLAALLTRHGATVMQATPATWRMLVDDGWAGGADLVAFCGGERLAPDLARVLRPRVRALWNLYGPTETTVWSTVAMVEDDRAAALIGRPLHNTSVHVLDARGAELPNGVPGELCIGGMGVALGYHERTQLTMDRFLDHSSLGRLYRTGDRGRIRSGGVLECLGRMDQQVKIRGYRIELGEIEAALAAHEDVGEAAVVVAEHEQLGARLLAFVATADGEEPSEWRRRLQQELPVYMVPHQLVCLPRLPRLPNGKLDRRALPRAIAAEGAVEFAAPANATEQLVASEMARVLGRQGHGADEDFFAAGGHSLLAAQLVSRLNRAVGSALSMRHVFEQPTPQGLAPLLTAMAAPAREASAQVTRRLQRDTAPATPVQERMWYLEQLAMGRSSYNLPSAHRLRGELDEQAFRAALQEVVRRQSVLRTTFQRQDGRLLQVVHERLRVEWPPIEDLGALPAAERERRLAARLDELAISPFDLTRLPLFRVQLFRLGPAEHVFFFMPHHMVWDGWSFDLLYAELDALYAAFAAGAPSPLPELAVDYGDIAAFGVERSTTAVAQERVATVRERLQMFGAVAALPVERARAPGMSGRGACEWLNVDAARTAALHQFAGAHGATVFATTLAIYAIVLREYSQRERVLLATPVRGRDGSEQEKVMGCCNRLVPLPIEVSDDAGFTALVQRVRRIVVAGLATAEVTLEQLWGAGRPPGSVLYQALFSFQDVRGRRRQWGDLQHEMIPLFQRGATEDLGLWFVEGEHGLSGMLTYNADVLGAPTVRRLRDRFLAILDAAIAAAQVPLAELIQVAPDRGESAAAGSTASASASARDAVAPPGVGDARNDFELILVRIWQRILGVARITVHDDFFDLGGNSLTAIRSVEEFERSTGMQLELGEVFRSPTAARLAASLVQKSTEHGPMLIPLQERGAAPPLFCLLGIWIYRHLAQGIGEDQPVFGVFVPEERAVVEGLLAPPMPSAESTSIGRLAAAYVEVITKHHPRGPYRLAGLSFGGVVAMEVARRLQARGEVVEGVVLIDSILPMGYRYSRWHVLGHSMWRGLRNGARRLAASVGLGALATGVSTGAHDERDTRAHLVADALGGEVSRWQETAVPPACPVLLLRAADNVWGAGCSPLLDYGWGQIVREGLQIEPIRGDHLGVLLTPDIGGLAGAMRRFFGGVHAR